MPWEGTSTSQNYFCLHLCCFLPLQADRLFWTSPVAHCPVRTISLHQEWTQPLLFAHNYETSNQNKRSLPGIAVSHLTQLCHPFCTLRTNSGPIRTISTQLPVLQELIITKNGQSESPRRSISTKLKLPVLQTKLLHWSSRRPIRTIAVHQEVSFFQSEPTAI